MTSRIDSQSNPKRDAGFTLIELLIASMLSVVLLIIVGGILINALKTERTVRTANEATSAGQLAVRSIGDGVKNASAIRLTTPIAGTQLLMTRSVGSGATAVWRCQAWYFADGELRTKSSGSAIMAPTATDLTSWTLLLADVQVTAAEPTGVFVLGGRRVDLDFQVVNGDGVPVLITTSAVSRQQMTSEPEAPICF